MGDTATTVEDVTATVAVEDNVLTFPAAPDLLGRHEHGHLEPDGAWMPCTHDCDVCASFWALTNVEAVLARYMRMSTEQRLVVALWVIHTWVASVLDQTMYLAITSPEKGCGKTRLLEILEGITARGWSITLPSEAVFYRTIHAHAPTVLLDETDAIFGLKNPDRYEGLRAAINAGFRRGAMVPRCIGTTNEVQNFRVYCPKALAGIGTLPETIVDRSIPIRLQRATKADRPDRLRAREGAAVFGPIQRSLQTWAAVNGLAVADARPDLPEAMSDRAQDGTESLIAIADMFGRGDEARTALVKLLTGERVDDVGNVRLRLLGATRRAFASYGDPTGIHTVDLLAWLNSAEDGHGGWGTFTGTGLDAASLAQLLHGYEVTSASVRVGDRSAKGYRRADLWAAWDRYLPSDVTDVTDVTPPPEPV